MAIGERLRRRIVAIALVGVGVAALAISVLLPGTRGSPPPRYWQLCEAPLGCRTVDVSSLALGRGVRELATVYSVSDRSEGPLAIHITGMASADIRWNGVAIGRNGTVGDTPATETPGKFDATITVPPSLVRTGPNRVLVRLSAQHLWAPVARPIHWLSVGAAAPDPVRVFTHYLPTLIVLGMLLAAFLACLGLWAASLVTSNAILSGLAATMLLQAAVETSKIAMIFPYPWQLARLVAVATLSTLAGLLLVLAGLGWVPDPRMRRWLMVAALAGWAAAWLLFPWWDAKAIWAIRVGLLTTLVSAAISATNGRLALAAGFACIAALGFSGAPDFLDFHYYLLATGLFAVHVLLGVRSLRRVEHAPIATRAAARAVEVILVPYGSAQQCVSVNDILYARADDDYSILHLCDGQELLATINLAALLRLAPERLLRVHRSHAINPDKIRVLHRAGKLARTVELVGGLSLRIGRTYWEGVAVRLLEPT